MAAVCFHAHHLRPEVVGRIDNLRKDFPGEYELYLLYYLGGPRDYYLSTARRLVGGQARTSCPRYGRRAWSSSRRRAVAYRLAGSEALDGRPKVGVSKVCKRRGSWRCPGVRGAVGHPPRSPSRSAAPWRKRAGAYASNPICLRDLPLTGLPFDEAPDAFRVHWIAGQRRQDRRADPACDLRGVSRGRSGSDEERAGGPSDPPR